MVGALSYGLVIGWTGGFLAWSLPGLACRALLIAAVGVSLLFLQADQLSTGLASALGGLLAHEALLAALARRVS